MHDEVGCGQRVVVIARSCLLALLLAAPSIATASGPAIRHWYDILLDNQRVGSVRDERIAKPAGGIETQTLTFAVQQLRHRSTITQTIKLTRDHNGGIVAVEFHGTGGAAPSAWHGTVRDGRLHLHEAGASAHGADTAFPGTVWTVAERARRLSPLWRDEAAAAAITALDATVPVAVAIKVERESDDTAPAGKPLLLSYRHAGGTNRERLWFDDGGTIARLDLQLLGVPVSLRPCASDCEHSPQAGIDPLARMVVRSPVRIPARALHATLRYVIERADGQAPQLAITREQDVRADGARAVVTVCADCGRDETPTPQELARYLAPNAWVRSDAPEVRQLARGAVPLAQRVDLRMRALVRATVRAMRGTSDFLGYADAVQALRSGSGDCTEFAVLLAALARAQRIPARVVAGLAYSSRFSGKKDVFSPHTWVQAWDGESWKSYDAALGDFDSTHIALAAGDGSPDGLNVAARQLPQLRIEKAAVVRDP